MSLAEPSLLQRFDQRDIAVLQQLEPGQTIRVDKIDKMYRRDTDIQRPQTIRTRVRDLLELGPFENEKLDIWRFKGIPGDTENCPECGSVLE